MLPMWKCCQSQCCQFAIGARRERAAWKAAFPVSGCAGAPLPTRLAEDGSPHRRQDGGSPYGRVALLRDRRQDGGSPYGRYNGNQLFFQAIAGLSERLVP